MLNFSRPKWRYSEEEHYYELWWSFITIQRLSRATFKLHIYLFFLCATSASSRQRRIEFGSTQTFCVLHRFIGLHCSGSMAIIMIIIMNNFMIIILRMIITMIMSRIEVVAETTKLYTKYLVKRRIFFLQLVYCQWFGRWFSLNICTFIIYCKRTRTEQQSFPPATLWGKLFTEFWIMRIYTHTPHNTRSQFILAWCCDTHFAYWFHIVQYDYLMNLLLHSHAYTIRLQSMKKE